MNIGDNVKILKGLYADMIVRINSVVGNDFFYVEVNNELIGYDITELEVLNE